MAWVPLRIKSLDEVRLGSIVNDPLIVASSPLQYREKAGTPLIAFKYDKPFGMQNRLAATV